LRKRSAEVESSRVRALDNESPLRITLLQALARGEKMDWILQKATELGSPRSFRSRASAAR
jgi:16S rRNA (uracil1498-N3)-methyltransferase